MRIGVDTGGTFTDAVAADGGVAKLRSSREDPAMVIARAVGLLAPKGQVELVHGTTVATTGLDHTLRLWDAAGECRDVFHGEAGGAPAGLAFASADRVVTTHRDGTAQTWDLAVLRERSLSFYALKDLHTSARTFADWCADQGDTAAARQSLEESLRFGEAAVRPEPQPW